MAGFLSILALSIAMFVGCMVAGWIPLAFSLSQRKIQLLTIFGAGLLVGTSLAVIIPEGVDMMYGHTHEEHTEVKRAAVVDPNMAMDMPIADSAFPSSSDDSDDDHHESHHEHGKEAHHAVGVSLLIGFVFMLLVDQIGGASHNHNHSHEIRLDRLNQSEVGYERSQSPDSKNKGTTATIGLVVHAAADGIAMGAAASTDRSDLQVIVFLAIMLHKAPAAFGLVSFLIHEGIEKRQLKKHLLIFALAAPVLTILTYLFLDKSDKDMLADANATGIAMLFSAGTFLYVATVHVLPEITHSDTGGRLSKFDVFVMVVGSMLPLVLNLGHSHEH